MGPRTPPYQIAFESGELAARVERAREALRSCRLCPRECGTDRLGDRLGFCRTGRRARVSGAFAHHGEESCLSGRGGSGTIFFASCNLRCVFCQNDDISRGGGGAPAGPEDLADAMLALQERGCHNINFVTPSHVVPQILEALLLAAGKGLRLPLVYNSGGYDSLRSLELMDGIADVYMPDFKFWDPAVAERLAAARDYPEAVMRFLAGLSRDTFVNIMGQYRPAGEAGAGGRHAEIGRRPFPSELEEAFALARGEGLRRFDR
jgi:putative pyruvate formate lyase activating enzyme